MSRGLYTINNSYITTSFVLTGDRSPPNLWSSNPFLFSLFIIIIIISIAILFFLFDLIYLFISTKIVLNSWIKFREWKWEHLDGVRVMETVREVTVYINLWTQRGDKETMLEKTIEEFIKSANRLKGSYEVSSEYKRVETDFTPFLNPHLPLYPFTNPSSYLRFLRV